MFSFLAGLLIGGALGMLAVCLCVAAGNADRGKEGLREDTARGRDGGRPGRS